MPVRFYFPRHKSRREGAPRWLKPRREWGHGSQMPPCRASAWLGGKHSSPHTSTACITSAWTSHLQGHTEFITPSSGVFVTLLLCAPPVLAPHSACPALQGQLISPYQLPAAGPTLMSPHSAFCPLTSGATSMSASCLSEVTRPVKGTALFLTAQHSPGFSLGVTGPNVMSVSCLPVTSTSSDLGRSHLQEGTLPLIIYYLATVCGSYCVPHRC